MGTAVDDVLGTGAGSSVVLHSSVRGDRQGEALTADLVVPSIPVAT